MWPALIVGDELLQLGGHAQCDSAHDYKLGVLKNAHHEQQDERKPIDAVALRLRHSNEAKYRCLEGLHSAHEKKPDDVHIKQA